MKWFVVKKLTDWDFFTVVVIGTGGRRVYNTNITISFIFQNHYGTETRLLSFICNVNDGKIVEYLKKYFVLGGRVCLTALCMYPSP